ncbi:receptor-like protein EIX2, partial [Prosopis cineraria]|uniref:receptor-like protein EIX2 n=1 Tax=Prosopis cineraria TaxID=364024 RepID=UPI00241084F6
MTWRHLQTVNLENNNFIGILNISIGSFPWLETLNLRNNNLFGNFPTFLKNTSNLVSLDLGMNQFSERIPSWVGQRLSNLRILVLRSNKFCGPIPRQLCGMSVLQILDLAQNELTGQIPKCVKHLSAMLVINSSLESSISFPDMYADSLLIVEELVLKGRVYVYSTILGLIISMDFSCNELSGVILTEITALKGLHFLNLSNNLFIGQIPQNIGNMKSLESMDFSRNHLSGEIPSSMSELSFLSFLDLSYNNLKGKIPTGTQLQSFEASNFAGNDLCGPPLTINCTSNGSNGKHQEVDHVNGINWFFVSMAFGFIVGFWAVVGPLPFSRSWSATFEAQCIPSEREALLKLKHHLSDPSNKLASGLPMELIVATGSSLFAATSQATFLSFTSQLLQSYMRHQSLVRKHPQEIRNLSNLTIFNSK